MLPERFRSMFRATGSPVSRGPYNSASKNSKASSKEVQTVRQSRGLEQFFTYINDQVGLSILDLAGLTQQNLDFVTDLGHKLYTQDFLRSLDDTFGDDDPAGQAAPNRIEYFLEQNLNFKENTFDGVLVWDTMQYLSPALLNATVERLHYITRPRSYLLAFFNADDKSLLSPHTNFRIQNQNTLMLIQNGQRQQAQVFNNRSLEKLFGQYESVKFFLTREHLREVIVKR